MQQYNISSGDMKVYDPNTDALVAWDEGSFIEDIINTFTFSNDSEKLDQSLKYALGLSCVDMIIIGFENPGQIDNCKQRMIRALQA